MESHKIGAYDVTDEPPPQPLDNHICYQIYQVMQRSDMRSANSSIYRWYTVLCAVALLMIAGCETSPIAREQTLTGDEGAVILKVIVNGRTTRSSPYDNLSVISLQREPAVNETGTRADSVRLTRTRALTQTTAVYSGLIAPGRYRIGSALGSENILGTTSNTIYTFPLASTLSGSFDVKSGEVTLLGTVLVQEGYDRNFQVGYLSPEAELHETFEEMFPALANQAKGKPIHSFELTPELTGRMEIARKIKKLSIASNGPTMTSDGAVFAGGKMGKVIWRKADDQRWHEQSVDTWKEVLSVRPYRNGLLIAGEQGLLRYSADEGNTWQELTPPDKGAIAIAAPLASGKVVAISRRELEWTAWVSEDVLKGAWRKLGTFPHESSINHSLVEFGAAVASGNRVGIMLPNGVFQAANGETGALERSSSGWTTANVKSLPDGMLVMRGIGVSATILISTNEGKTWVDLDTSRFVLATAFADVNTAYAIAPIVLKTFGNTFGLMVSRDRGKTWTQTGQIPSSSPDDVRELVFDRTNKALLAFLRSGQIMLSRDEGKTWTRDL